MDGKGVVFACPIGPGPLSFLCLDVTTDADLSEDTELSHDQLAVLRQLLQPLGPSPTVIAPLLRAPRAAKKRWRFRPDKNLTDDSRLDQRARHTDVFDVLDAWDDNNDLFETLWPGCRLLVAGDEVAETSEKRLGWTCLAFLARLAHVSPVIRRLVREAPDSPDRQVHVVNALCATLKSTVRQPARIVSKALDFLANISQEVVPDEGRPPPGCPFPKLMLYLTSLLLLLQCTPRLVVDFQCQAPADFVSRDDDHKMGWRLEGLFSDVLRIKTDEEETLAVILQEAETQLLEGDGDVPVQCNHGHPMARVDFSYSPNRRSVGPPPLLFFEAADVGGIPRHVISEEVWLADEVYDFVAAIGVTAGEEDGVLLLAVQPELTDETTSAVALVAYARRDYVDSTRGQCNEKDDQEDDQEDSMDMQILL